VRPGAAPVLALSSPYLSPSTARLLTAVHITLVGCGDEGERKESCRTIEAGGMFDIKSSSKDSGDSRSLSSRRKDKLGDVPSLKPHGYLTLERERVVSPYINKQCHSV
jgi:hypothetical protein